MEAAASETLGPGEREAKRPEQTRAAPAEVWTVVAGVLQVCTFSIFFQYDDTIRDLRKENFNLKLRIYFLEERLGTTRMAGNGGGNKEELVQANIDLKVNIESLKYDIKEKTELLAAGKTGGGAAGPAVHKGGAAERRSHQKRARSARASAGGRSVGQQS